jgi:dynamin GTPase/dynamin 1-like protein
MRCSLFYFCDKQFNQTVNFEITFTERVVLNDVMLCRENLLDEMLRETDEVIIRRQRIQETLQVLEQAHRVSSVS